MGHLNEAQRKRAIEAMREYLNAVDEETGKPIPQIESEFDRQRVDLIKNELKPLISGFLENQISMAEFKTQVDGINKRNELWGFKGIKGQMFFNMVVNVADDPDECEQEIKGAIAVPQSEQIASSRIKTFESYVKRLGTEWVDAGNSKHGRPKIGSIPFFLSYFWQVQDRDTWNVYYTNTVQTLKDMNLWQPSGEIAKDYIEFNKNHEELRSLFSKESGRSFSLYDVEHVFWYKGGNPYVAAISKSGEKVEVRDSVESEQPPTETWVTLPESFVPPVVAILPRIARHEEELIEAARRSGTSLEHAFEKNINAAFTILGFETKQLGHGKGRVPDGIAKSVDDSYAILWDAKVRKDRYSMGTDDRTIREYITTQSRDMKRKGSLRNIYYVIVSSEFADDFDDTIREIKMDTDVNEVILMEAEALVKMVDLKLKDPLQVSLGVDGMQRLFSSSGRLTANDVMKLYS